MDDSSVFEQVASSDDDFAPAPVAKPKAKPAPKKAAKPASRKMQQTTLKAKPASRKRAKPESEDDEPEQDAAGNNDESLLSSTPPSSKKQKKGPTKKTAGKPLEEIQNEGTGFDGDGGMERDSTDATDRYQMLSQLEHILKRPDTYIGSVERTEKQLWVYNSTTESMESREVSFVPGLYKIFDEIVVNAADNKQNDQRMDTIKVTVDREKGEISVMNNGKGIPIEIHKKTKIYIPEMIFGHLLTSSNYNDDQQKVTGGRNGYGAKLCNVFSTEFSIETTDSRSGKKYKQTWTNNMSKMDKAKITSCKVDDYTKVTFKPDFAKFGMDGMDDDFEALVKRRVYDLAGTVRGVKVLLNGERIKIKNFEQYMKMYTKAIQKENGEEGEVTKIISESPDPRWEIGFAVSDGSFQQVSFVNSIATTSGGTHVNYICDQIANRLLETVKKKNKNGPALKNHQIRNHMFLFVNCLVVNPAFTSQTKEQLTTKASQFGSKCVLSEEFLKKVARTEVVNRIINFAQHKADQLMKKTDGSRRSRMNNPKLVDANLAGTKDGHRCTLILTEGDSAKGLAVAGRAVVGPDLFGVFPLRGKLLNVRDASIDQVAKNAEIQSIKNFLGLQHKKEYSDTKSLRYGHLMIMTDQDFDGSHIKGLLINFLHHNFPSLLKIEGFLIEFITPIVKIWKGDPKRPTKSLTFFTMPEYEAWKEAHRQERNWEHKYYKGLGTSTTEDAQVYFRDLDRHLKQFDKLKQEEEQFIELAFSKKKADERKEWLRRFEPGTYLDHSADRITYDDFVNKELILFSQADNIRSIPSVIDGLKPGQRKVLWSCFKRNLKKDMKVVELAGYVSGISAYQHGETSLHQTIVGLAQTFVGSNNVNFLEPSGNYGSRLQGGSDAASARYIYTRLSPFARQIFKSADDPLLTYNTDDDQKIEPQIYCPVIPMILVNGADGIGTGWSTQIPNYNPEDVVANLRRLMDGQPIEPMVPWFRGWNGEVTDLGGGKFKFSGIIKQTGDNEVEITELPIRMWTQDFKDKLEEIIKAEKVPSFIKDYTDYNTHVKVHFIIQMEDKHIKISLEEGLEEKFKLSKIINTTNLVAFDPAGRIKKYATVDEILQEFYGHRIKFYEKRKAHQLAEMQRELDKLSNQARFVKMIIDGELVVYRKKKKDLIVELQANNFRPFPKVSDGTKDAQMEPFLEGEDDAEEPTGVPAGSYDYLLGMAIWSLTHERVEKLMQQIGDKEVEIDALIKLSKEDLWRKDLDDFIAEWRFQLDDETRQMKKNASMGRRVSAKLTVGGKAAARKRKVKDEDGSDSDFVASKPKKPIVKRAQPKAGNISDFFKKSTSEEATAAASRNQTKAASNVDDLSGSFSSEDPIPAKRKPIVKPKKLVLDDDDDLLSDIGDSLAEAPARRGARPTAKQSVNYNVISDLDSENDGDLLGDVSKMVKGISGGVAGSSASSTKDLFAASKPRSNGTSTNLSKLGSKPASRQTFEISDEDTDYSKLVPKASPKRASAKAEISSDSNSEDDDGSLALEAPKATAVKAKTQAKAPNKAKPAPAVPKKAAPAPKKEPVVRKSTAPAKTAPLSPAAKAYAKKQSKANTTKKKVDSDSDDDEEALANDLLESSDEDIGAKKSAPAPRAASSRPPRRAAAAVKKPVYVDDLSSEDEAQSNGEDAFSENLSEDE